MHGCVFTSSQKCSATTLIRDEMLIVLWIGSRNKEKHLRGAGGVVCCSSSIIISTDGLDEMEGCERFNSTENMFANLYFPLTLRGCRAESRVKSCYLLMCLLTLLQDLFAQWTNSLESRFIGMSVRWAVKTLPGCKWASLTDHTGADDQCATGGLMSRTPAFPDYQETHIGLRHGTFKRLSRPAFGLCSENGTHETKV